MNIDLREDAVAILAMMASRVALYLAGNDSPDPVSAVEVGFNLCQSGWVYVHFDGRPEHQRDGEWTRFDDGDLLDRPGWLEACERLEHEAVPVTLMDGSASELPEGADDEQICEFFGSFLRQLVLNAHAAGAFERLPKRANFQLDLEDFNGVWAWPAFDEMGRVNLLK